MMIQRVIPDVAGASYDVQRDAFVAADRGTRRAMLGQLTPCEVEFAGIRMWVDPRDNYTERRIWMDGQPPEMKSLVALMELVEGRNALVLDIGANCGAFAVPLGMAVGAGSRVRAFEPNPVMVDRLTHNIALNDLGDVIAVEACALGAQTGQAMLNFRRRNFGQATLMAMAKGVQDGGKMVPVRPLSDFTADAPEHDITVLKIDVEGGEEAVLLPLLAGDWLPDAMLVETVHADQWQSDLIGAIRQAGFAPVLKVEGNTLFTR